MIELREVQPNDKDQLLAWRNMPDVTRFMYSDHIITLEEHTEWFEKVLIDNTKQYWVIELDGEGVGVANITDIDIKNRRCFWAFYLASPAVRGRGVGSFVEYSILRFVFEDLQLNKLCCEVLAFNDTVVQMHKKHGFKQEGLFRHHIFKDGQFHDVVRLAILESEWREIKPDIEVRLRNKGLIE